MNYMRDELEENPTDVDKLENEMTEKFMANIRPDVTLDGFTFDSTKVSTQFAAVEAAMGTYWYPLLNGMVDDVFKNRVRDAVLKGYNEIGAK